MAGVIGIRDGAPRPAKLEIASFEIGVSEPAFATLEAGNRRELPHDVAAEATLLILCLRGVLLAIPAGINWRALCELAGQNGVLLPLYRRLLELPDLGAGVPDSFHQSVLATQIAAEAMAAALESLLQAFVERGIEVLPLKGPALALALYGDAAMRQTNDLDLLVRRSDFSSAEAVLLGLGFSGLGKAGDHDRRFLRGELLVELHFELASPRFFPFEADSIWSSSSPASFRGLPIRSMSRNDLMLYLCAHGLKHGFSRLIWILDLAHALRACPSSDYPALVQQAQSQGLLAWLLIGCEVVRIMFPELMPEELDRTFARFPAALMRAHRAAQRLFPEKPGVETVDYRALYLQAEVNPLRRWRYRFRYLAPTDTDEMWARHHRIHPALMFLLRPFRLIGRYGLARTLRTLFPSGV